MPYAHTLADAVSWTAQPRGPAEPWFLILSHEEGSPVLVGGVTIADLTEEAIRPVLIPA